MRCAQALAQRQVEVLRALLDAPHLQQSATPEEEQFALDKGCEALFSGNAALLTAGKADSVLVPERGVQVLAPQKPVVVGEGAKAEAEGNGVEGGYAGLGMGLGLGAQPRVADAANGENAACEPVFKSAGVRPAELDSSGDAAHVKAEAKQVDARKCADAGAESDGVLVMAARQPAAAHADASRTPSKDQLSCVEDMRGRALPGGTQTESPAAVAAPAGMRAKRSVCLDGAASAQLSSGALSEQQGSIEVTHANGRQDVLLAVNSKRRCGQGRGGKQKACRAKVNGKAGARCPLQDGWGLGLQIPTDDPFRDYAKHVWHEDAGELGWQDSGQFRGWFLDCADAHDLQGNGDARGTSDLSDSVAKL